VIGRRSRRIRRALGRADRRLLAAAIGRRTPTLDRVMTTASTLANRSRLWIAVAALLAATGRRRPRTAAASGLAGIGVAATLVNGPLKFAWRRDRPPITVPGPRGAPLLPLPRTFSFPSGHSASAAAFATGVGVAMPPLAPVVGPMAATVAYSRVHTGVHYPSDVAVGAAVGVASGFIGAAVVRRVRARSVHFVDAPALDVQVPDRAVVVTSEAAGSADGLDAALRSLEAAGWAIEQIVKVEDVDSLRSLTDGGAAAPLLIAAGGDGTVGAVANVLAGTDALLAVIPLGTSNDVARSLGIPPDAVEAGCLVPNGRVCAIDAVRLRTSEGTERVFLNAATAGLNVAFARHATEPSMREQFGRLTYPVAAARAVRGSEPFECTLECDGERTAVAAVHLSVSNAPVFGGVLGMRVPGASLTDGLLDVIAVERLSLPRLVLAVADAFVGRHTPVHGVHAMRVPRLRVSAESDIEIAVDGEVLGALPAEFEVLPAAVRVVVPKR
jgi:YegS/Rv2252/BmrU family lipid kinase